MENLKTLNDFQKLLGGINWIRPNLGITTGQLKPLFDILQGDSDPTSPRNLTPEGIKSLMLVEQVLGNVHSDRVDLSLPFSLIALDSEYTPTGLLWQTGPLIWIHLPVSPQNVFPHIQ